MKKYLFPLLLVFTFQLEGISQEKDSTAADSSIPFYERYWLNFTAYFNAYYNAERLYSKTIQAFYEQNLKTGTEISSVFPVFKKGSIGRQELQKVVNKTTAIVQTSTGSDLIDDALLLMGKSYYFMGDFSPAERKFKEIISNYTDRDVVFQSTLFLARTYLDQSKSEEALTLIEGLVQRDDVPESVKGEANLLLADRYYQIGYYERAINFLLEGIELYDDDEARARASYLLAKAYLNQKKYSEAAAYFRQSGSYSSLPAVWYWAGVREIGSYLEGGLTDEAESVLNRMLNDDDLGNYHSQLELERARLAIARNEYEEGIKLYRSFILDNPTSVQMTAAWFELGKLHQEKLNDQELAKYFYDKGSAGTATDSIVIRSKEASALLKDYLDLRYDLLELDSVIALGVLIPEKIDTLQKDSTLQVPDSSVMVAMEEFQDMPESVNPQRDFPQPQPTTSQNTLYDNNQSQDDSGLFDFPEQQDFRDNQRTVGKNQVAGLTDEKPDPFSEAVYGKLLLKNNRKNKFMAATDSASMALLDDNYESVIEKLVEYFYFRNTQADSVRYYVNRLEKRNPVSKRLPRLIYARSAVYFAAGKTEEYNKDLNNLLSRFPKTEYGTEARIRLGLPDSIGMIRQQQENLLNKAVTYIDKVLPDSALFVMDLAQTADSTAPYYTRILYAAGYLNEYLLNRPDSAQYYYQRILKEFAQSPLAKQLRPLLSTSVKPDRPVENQKREEQSTETTSAETGVAEGGPAKARQDIVFSINQTLPQRFKRQPKPSVIW